MRLMVSVQGHRLMFRFTPINQPIHSTKEGAAQKSITINLLVSTFKNFLHDYALLCESYHASAASRSYERLEAIDIGRRALHNDAAEDLRQRLSTKITMDTETARSLFTVLVAILTRITPM